MVRNFVRTVLTVFKKDMRIWIQQPINTAATVVPVLCFLLVTAMGAGAVGRSPVALITLDHGAKGQQMQQILHDADVFRVIDTTPTQAQELFKNISVVAVITIPADFTQRITTHQPDPINVRLNNLNDDFGHDVRDAVPDAITQFYAAQGQNSEMKVQVQEHDLRQQDVELFQYTLAPIMILLLTMSGVVNSGLATAREWEELTVKELLFAPVSGNAIIVGKVLAGFFTTMLLGALVIVAGNLFGWVHLQGIYWLTAMTTIALIALVGAGIGVAMGAVLQRLHAMIGLGLNMVLYLFFLAGGVGVLAFMQDWLQVIAAYIPLTYGRHALEMAVFYNSAEFFGRDTAILGGSALLALVLGFLAMRRKVAA